MGHAKGWNSVKLTIILFLCVTPKIFSPNKDKIGLPSEVWKDYNDIHVNLYFLKGYCQWFRLCMAVQRTPNYILSRLFWFSKVAQRSEKGSVVHSIIFSDKCFYPNKKRKTFTSRFLWPATCLILCNTSMAAVSWSYYEGTNLTEATPYCVIWVPRAAREKSGYM